MAGMGVFVLRDDRTLVAMQPAQFAREADFQELLADFPALLAGDQIDAATPRRFMLVTREQGVADQEGGGGRWSLDHLFLDQDGVPTLVEVKRQSDTRLRREVIGQMLDYAANGVSHWSMEELRAGFAGRCVREGLDPLQVLGELVGEEQDPDAFWATVRTNLQAGKIRMLFVADMIPPEVRKIVEFLNRQMQPAEVLAVELRQYEGEGLKMLSPIVIGQSQEVAERRGSSSGRRWTVETILQAMKDEPAVQATARTIMDWVQANADRVQVNASARGSMGPMFSRDGVAIYPFLIDGSGQLTLYLADLASKPVFSDPALRDAFAAGLNAAGLTVPDPARRTALPLSSFTPQITAGFLSAIEWFKSQLQT